MFRIHNLLKTTVLALTLGMLGANDARAQSQVLDTHSDIVLAHANEQYTLTLQAGVSYTIIVDGDGSTDLDAFLIDENGNTVAQDVDLTDFCVLRVRPRWTGQFTLRVRNLGSEANRFQILLMK